MYLKRHDKRTIISQFLIFLLLRSFLFDFDNLPLARVKKLVILFFSFFGCLLCSVFCYPVRLTKNALHFSITFNLNPLEKKILKPHYSDCNVIQKKSKEQNLLDRTLRNTAPSQEVLMYSRLAILGWSFLQRKTHAPF